MHTTAALCPGGVSACGLLMCPPPIAVRTGGKASQQAARAVQSMEDRMGYALRHAGTSVAIASLTNFGVRLAYPSGHVAIVKRCKTWWHVLP